MVKDDLFEMVCPVDEKIIKQVLREKKQAELKQQLAGLPATVGVVMGIDETQVDELPATIEEVLRTATQPADHVLKSPMARKDLAMLKFYDDPPDWLEAAKALDNSSEFRVLRRLALPSIMTAVPEGLYKALYVDVETTGLDPAKDKVIEFGGIPFYYDADGIIHGIGEPLGGFMDPGTPIPEFVVKLTGITDDMVKGQHFDTGGLENELASTGLVIAHNASFDRPMCERMLPAFEAKPWACSMKEVDWKELGADNLALSSLLVWLGYFYDGHRAWVDCLAGIALLAHEQAAAEGRTGLSMLLESAREDRITLKAIDTPFETKDLLKERGYKWDAGGSQKIKGWFTELAEQDLVNEKVWLTEHIYSGSPAKVTEERQNARQRYKGS